MGVVDAAPRQTLRDRGSQEGLPAVRGQVVDLEAREDLFLDELKRHGRAETQLRREPRRDGIELEAAMPGRFHRLDPASGDRRHERLRRCARGAHLYETTQQRARIEED